MAPVLDQSKRIAKLHAPFPETQVGVHRFVGNEGLSDLFEFEVEVYSTLDAIDFDQALGTNVSVELKSFDGKRVFDGILVAARWLGKREAFYHYRLVLKPWYWLLTRTTDCRLFHDKSVPDICEEVFGEYGFAKFEKRLSESYPPLEYCVQYRETDFAFTSRLMEKFGIYYYFEHDVKSHRLIMADSKSSHSPPPGGGTLPYIALGSPDRHAKEHVYRWEHGRSFNTGKVAYNDYDFEKPQADLLAEAEGQARYAESKLEIYDYPGKYVEQGKGERFAKVWLQAEQARDHRRVGTGDAASVFPGALVTLSGHPSGAQNIEYLVTRANHAYEGERFRTGAGDPAAEPYEGSYEFLPSSTPFRAPLVTPKPVIAGAQTAEVVGEGEIDVDKYGRILVKFHWDRDEKDSCRIRVGQVWSGKSWGGIYWPRVGQEVIVQFLEGDPDRPMVVGTVYNGDHDTPYDLPSKKTIAGVKSDSTEGGGGFNEFTFEDKKGQEEVYLHAERDFRIKVKRDERREVDRDVTRRVTRDVTDTVGRNVSETVGSNVSITIGGNRTETLGGNWSVSSMGPQSFTSVASITHTVAPSTVTMNPGMVSTTAPMVNITAMGLVNVNAGIINLTAGIINLTGLVLVNGKPIL